MSYDDEVDDALQDFSDLLKLRQPQQEQADGYFAKSECDEELYIMSISALALLQGGST